MPGAALEVDVIAPSLKANLAIPNIKTVNDDVVESASELVGKSRCRAAAARAPGVTARLWVLAELYRGFGCCRELQGCGWAASSKIEEAPM